MPASAQRQQQAVGICLFLLLVNRCSNYLEILLVVLEEGQHEARKVEDALDVALFLLQLNVVKLELLIVDALV